MKVGTLLVIFMKHQLGEKQQYIIKDYEMLFSFFELDRRITVLSQMNKPSVEVIVAQPTVQHTPFSEDHASVHAAQQNCINIFPLHWSVSSSTEKSGGAQAPRCEIVAMTNEDNSTGDLNNGVKVIFQ